MKGRAATLDILDPHLPAVEFGECGERQADPCPRTVGGHLRTLTERFEDPLTILVRYPWAVVGHHQQGFIVVPGEPDVDRRPRWCVDRRVQEEVLQLRREVVRLDDLIRGGVNEVDPGDHGLHLELQEVEAAVAPIKVERIVVNLA